MKRALLSLALALLALGGWLVLREDAGRPPSVLLVIADTTRVDRLGCYGGSRGLTPNLDELAAGGLRFEHAASHAPWTLPAVASILTSLHPKEHGAGGWLREFTGLDPEVATLPGVFRRRGWRTHAIVNVGFLNRNFGVMRDFERLDSISPTSNLQMRDARRTTDAALEWLDQNADAPFFLLVHYFDAHAVYAPPQPFRRRFAGPRDRGEASWVFGTRSQVFGVRGGGELHPGAVRRAEKLYDGEVAFMDDQIGRLLAALESRGRAEDTIVVVTADHGEEFLDHGGWEHGHTLYDELTSVPLIVSYPAAIEPGVVSQQVAHVDIAPTLCELVDIDAPEGFVGQSLLTFVRDSSAPGHAVLAHGNMWGTPLTSWRTGTHKLIVGPEGMLQLFDLEADPEERIDLATRQPARAQRLLEQLRRAESAMAELERGVPVELRGELLEELRAQGYVQGAEDEQEGGPGEDR